jgi:hypothetical protein
LLHEIEALQMTDSSKRKSYESTVDKSIDVDSPLSADVIEEFRYRVGEEANRELDDDAIRRFLAARGGSMLKGTKMARDTNEWRHTLMAPMRPRGLRFSPNIIMANPDLLANHEAVSWIPATHHGYDKEGAPIYWERTGYVQCNWSKVKKFFTVDELVQYHIQSQQANELRYGHASKKFGTLITSAVTVFDMKHLTMSLDPDSIMYIKTILGVDQGNFPERLKHLFLINAPWYIHLLYKIFLPFIDARTAAKFIILDGDYMPTLTKYIDISMVPTEMGGEANVMWSGNFTDDSGVSDNQIKAFMGAKYGNGGAKRLLRPEEQEALRKAVGVAVETGVVSVNENYLSPGVEPTKNAEPPAGADSPSTPYVPADNRRVKSSREESVSWDNPAPAAPLASGASSAYILKVSVVVAVLSMASLCLWDSHCRSLSISIISLHVTHQRPMMYIYGALIVLAFLTYMYYACRAMLKNFRSVCSFC